MFFLAFLIACSPENDPDDLPGPAPRDTANPVFESEADVYAASAVADRDISLPPDTGNAAGALRGREPARTR
jgi:hypothetical protein